MGAVDEKTVRPPLMDANQRGVMSLSIQVLNDQCCAKGFRCYQQGRQCRLGATLHLNSTTKHFGKGAGMLFRILLLTKHQKTPHLDPPQGQQGLLKVGLSAPRSYQGVFIS